MQRTLTHTIIIAMFIFVLACTQQANQQGQQEKTITPIGGPPVSRNEPLIDESHRAVAKEKDDRDRTGRLSTPAPMEMKKEAEYSSADAVMSQSPALGAVGGMRALNLAEIRYPSEPLNRENYAHYDNNPVKRAFEQPVSTFSIDVDTGSYANVRRFLQTGSLPVQDAVRAEELINYFSYDYPVPKDTRAPFALTREIAPTPWNPDTLLLHIGIQGYEVPAQQLPAANLVFLVDVSGSMQSPDKLDLLKSSLKLLIGHLHAQDRIALVVYAGGTGVVLEPTPGDQKAKITAALDQLTAGGRTNGAAGIKLAYAMAEQGYIQNGINRVLLATDGDFNVGTTNFEQLKDLVEEKRKTGIALSTLGFGTGNYNDQLMEQLADTGNGNYAYIDTLGEAQKVLVDEMTSTLMTIAKDVKIQIEFNPAVVEEYRLVGYENRMLKREDFNNDKIDAGEIGAGHSVTALYEITLKGSKALRMDPLRYQNGEETLAGKGGEIAFLRLRYKDPQADTSKLLEWAIQKNEIVSDLGRTSDAFRFSAAVAAFAQQLRGGEYLGKYGYHDIMSLASAARGQDPFGYRGEFLTLVNLASSLSQPAQTPGQVAHSNVE